MEIFVTGGTGYIGRHVVRELAAARHHVVALNRTSAKEPMLNALGAVALPGNLLEPDGWRGAAARADAVVHVAFDYGAVLDADRTALDTLLEATADRASRLVYTSGLWVVGELGDRIWGDDAPTDHPAAIVEWRVAHEKQVLASSVGGRAAAVIRPGHVYGHEGGFPAGMFDTALRTGAAEYVGDGSNWWSMIHVEDLARLYRRVVEAGATGMFNGVDGVPVRVREVAEASSLAAGAGGRTRGIPLAEAREKLGGMADAMCLSQPLSAPAARALGWTPECASFTDAAPRAFEEWRRAAERQR